MLEELRKNAEERLTTKEAAKLLKLSARTLERYRQNCTGPRYAKGEKFVYYYLEDLKEWQDNNRKI